MDDVYFYSGKPSCCALSPDACQREIAFANPDVPPLFGAGAHTCAEVCPTESLSIPGTSLPVGKSLGGLECLVNLREFDAKDDQISDISALSGLSYLRSLSLDGNTIADISALAALIQLRSASLSANRLTDISALAALTKLETLNLKGNQIVSVASLSQQLEDGGLVFLTSLGEKVVTTIRNPSREDDGSMARREA